MSGGASSERTEAPTPKKFEDAAKKGDVLMSRELAVALVMVAGAAWLLIAGGLIAGALQTALREGLTIGRGDILLFDPGPTVVRLLTPLAMPFAALFGMTLVAAIAAPALLGSLGFRSAGFAYKGSRISPGAGFARMFGPQGAIGMIRSFANVAVVGGVGAWLAMSAARALSSPIGFDVRAGAATAGAMLGMALTALVAALAAIALVDVPVQYATRIRRLRMTHQEVRDEHRQSEGSPENKMALRARRHLLLSQSTRKAVAEATVVLTNPTHFAVALRYRPGEDSAPLVVARGRGATALAIRELAVDSAVPILGSPPLTRAIYYTSRTGAHVREELYLAVATVLAFVFRLDAQARADGMVAPEVTLPDGFGYDADGRRGP